MAKNIYVPSYFLMMNTGKKAVRSHHGLLTPSLQALQVHAVK
jgi:glycerol kinase